MSAIEREDVSSIGPMWPPLHTTFERIKGFYNKGIIREPQELEDFSNELLSLRATMVDSEPDLVSRISVRAVIDDNLIFNLQNHAKELLCMGEAVVPLGGRLSRCSIVYFGCNAESRKTDEKDELRVRLNVQAVRDKKVGSFSKIVRSAGVNGYKVEVMKGENATFNDFLDLLVLYRKFGWDIGQVVDLAHSEKNLLVVAKYHEKIVSAGIAEMSSIRLDRDNIDLRMVELTDAATLDDHQGRGLYTAVSTVCLGEIGKLSSLSDVLGGEVDIIYGECNAASIGVLGVARTQGRIFASDVAERDGLPFSGVLRQHVCIFDGVTVGEYNDLFPAFLDKNLLERFINS